MRRLLALLYAICTLSVASPTPASPDSDAAASAKFRGDRIVIFRDDSPAFAAFAQNVLRDPEVAAFMNEHFAVYTVNTGSPEAEALPFLGGARLDPRIVIVAPRLDNLSAHISPSFSKTNFLALLRDVQHSTTMQEFVSASAGRGGFAGPTAENMTAWAREFYPALTEPGVQPDGLLIGFLISSDMKVLKHSVKIAAPGAPVTHELQRMFPQAGVPERTTSGASCFGGITPKEAKYCVCWALVAN